MEVLIFGTGSIACRHSRILKMFGYKVIGVTARGISVSELHHENEFDQIVAVSEWEQVSADKYVVATTTNQHTEIVQKLINFNIPKENIFCEKPGPVNFLGVNILYNLTYLKGLNEIGPVLEVVHCANAKGWPSDIAWQDRYVFNRRMLGGVVLTHSHEFIHCFRGLAPTVLENKNNAYIYDKNCEKLQTYHSAYHDGIKFTLDLLAKHPLRYWRHQDATLHFYGELPETSNACNIIKITTEMIDESYIDMWKDVLKGSNSMLRNDFSWVFNLAS